MKTVKILTSAWINFKKKHYFFHCLSLVPTLLICGCIKEVFNTPACYRAGNPAITKTSVPPIGSTNPLMLTGTTTGVSSDTYALVVYLYVNGLGWYGTKPQFDSLTPLQCNGSNLNFSCNVNTGGRDSLATKYELYVVRKNYQPPNCSPCDSLPATLAQNALVSKEVDR